LISLRLSPLNGAAAILRFGCEESIRKKEINQSSTKQWWRNLKHRNPMQPCTAPNLDAIHGILFFIRTMQANQIALFVCHQIE
jgi:hypothetical protein